MARTSPRQDVVATLLLGSALMLTTGCGALKNMAVNTVANELAASGTVFSRDNDPELVRDAIPFALKLYESLLESVPKNRQLLVATCSAFTQYAYGFIETDAEVLGPDRQAEASLLKARALRLYVRAKDYCLRAMDARWKGMSAALVADPVPALARARKDDVPMLYWTAASWGAAISLGLDQPDLVVDLPTVRALADRAIALDETWSRGALHELLITLNSLPEALGGSPDRAKKHFEAAIKIQNGLSAGPYVALATGVMVPAQDRAGFEKLLNQALAIDPAKDPEYQLVTLITQRRARALLQHIDAKFAKF